MYVNGLGMYVPERILDNHELSGMVDTSDEWITSRTGIRQRRLAAPGQACSDLVVEAAKRALDAAGIGPDRITHVIVGTVSGDASFPSTACYTQSKLGIERAMAFDLSAACSGFLYGLELARGLLALDSGAIILLAGAEVLSHLVDWQDRATCVLFGDGAGAAVLSARSDPGQGTGASLNGFVEGVVCAADGRDAPLLYCVGCGSSGSLKTGETMRPEHGIHMNGQEVFKRAIRAMSEAGAGLLERLNLTLADVDLVVPHQANIRIIDAVARRLGVPEEKLFLNLDRYGNTSAASIPMALTEALERGVIQEGMRVLLCTFGAGLTWGASVWRFEEKIRS